MMLTSLRLKKSGTPTGELQEHIGLDNLPDQLVRSKVDEGFNLNVLVVGESCIGKSTLVESLFGVDFDCPTLKTDSQAVSVSSRMRCLCEGAVRVKTTVAMSHNLGEQLDKTGSTAVVSKYVDARFQDFLEQERRGAADEAYGDDSRIHVCILMLNPTGTSAMRPLDVKLLQALHQRVNVIPVIAKADSLVAADRDRFKQSVRQQLKKLGISTYMPPVDSPSHASYAAAFPLAVVASRSTVQGPNGVAVRARQYPWGNVDVENPAFSDLSILRDVVLCDNTYNLMGTTHSVHYERFRAAHLRRQRQVDDEGESGDAVQTDGCFHDQSEVADLRRKLVKMVSDKEREIEAARTELVNKFDKLKNIHEIEERELRAQLQLVDDELRRY
eukprot:m.630487 g.630487  ORF g.630487 m.630487 type:complete len:386 (+) comp22567_c1_seq6:388-1545(+)